MTAYHIRESQARIVARCVALVDPLALVVAGLWLTLQLRRIAESWMQHHPMHYLAWAVALYAGIVLIGANAMVPLSLLARGLGISNEVFRDVRLRHFAFWTGIALVVLSHDARAMPWTERQDPLPDYTGTAILTIIGSMAIFFGTCGLARAAWNAATTALLGNRCMPEAKKSISLVLTVRGRSRSAAVSLKACFVIVTSPTEPPGKARYCSMASAAQIAVRSQSAHRGRQKPAARFTRISIGGFSPRLVPAP